MFYITNYKRNLKKHILKNYKYLSKIFDNIALLNWTLSIPHNIHAQCQIQISMPNSRSNFKVTLNLSLLKQTHVFPDLK